MLFSIIIPTYNPGEYLDRMLASINRNFCIQDMEIILADDCSDEDLNIYKEHYPELTIHIIKNDKHYGFPRHGRQNGANQAKGDWITFADQDDWFEDNTFDMLRRYLYVAKPVNYIVTSMRIMNEQEPTILHCPLNWTHGKFYEKIFWDKYNLHYDDIDYCEDVNLTTKVMMTLCNYNLGMYSTDVLTYNWDNREGSLSDRDSPATYFFSSMPDYIKVALEMLLDEYDRISSNNFKDMNDDRIFLVKNFYYTSALSVFLRIYFYFQAFIMPSYKCPEIPQEYYDQLQKMYVKFLTLFHINTNVMKKYITVDFYEGVRHDSHGRVPFIESMSFFEWIDKYLEPKEPIKIDKIDEYELTPKLIMA